ncbi:hypothetical protein J3458_017962 [Metarhizium acridum]|uniref:uncharacterized protein n=1 Tax=Metarhizium acridum TaxID=92637 RepID=UPI001C6BA0F2|nr:hypothetical protein J3458_017962 [Metarhizium acridum]
MTSAAVTPSMRAVAWNVHFTIGEEEDSGAFAGIFQVSGSDLITFRDVCDELRLCFEFSNDKLRGDSHDNDNEHDSWSHIAFYRLDTDNLTSSSLSGLRFITGSDLDEPVPSLASLRPKEQNVVRYHLVHHEDCHMPSNSSLDSHLQAKCARHLPNPVRRRDARYLPPNRTPSDPRLAVMPLRRKLKARSQSPPKRPASGSNSPTKEASDEFDDMLAPATMNIDIDEAKRVTNDFRSSCLNRATSCAVSGEGESWCPGPPIGPGIQACHIVPQQHYHLYPVSSGLADGDVPIEESPRRLQEAWRSTWSPRNGILLMKHLHEFFDARLFSIHPRTLRIRVFVPYDALIRFNGQKATVSSNVDRKALRHHYEMSCIENMAAERPNLDPISPATSRMTSSGLSTPLTTRTDLPATPSSGVGETEIGASKIGDPNKRSRPTYPARSLSRNNLSQNDFTALIRLADWEDKREPKRRRLENNDISLQHDFFQQVEMVSHITPWNSREFLADVDWELQKFKQGQTFY